MSRTMQQTGNEAFTQDLAPVIDDFAGWTAVCRADDLVPDGGICVLVRAAGKAEQIAIFSVAGELYAVSNRDPIGGAAVLSRGITGNIGEHVVVASPLYKQHYDLLQPDDGRREAKGVVAVVADGASCSEEARLASQTAVLTFIQDYMSTPDSWDVKTSASRVLSALNAWLHRGEALPGARHDTLVTTFSAVICKSTTLHLLHCGDSRIWRLRAGKLQQLSMDHNVVLPEGCTALSRALGLDRHAKVDYQSRTLQEQDLLMLTTDGVHAVLDAERLAALLQPLAEEAAESAEGSNRRLEACSRAIVDAALAAGSEDNLSCLLLQVRQLPQQDLDEIHRELTRRVIPPVLEPGQRIDAYTVERVLHASVRSHLYVVSHPRLRHTCVLKAPSPNIAEEPEGLEAFLREQWVARRIDHPNVMRVVDAAVDSRFLYHVCEHIPGCTLRQWMRDHPQPDLATVRDLVRQIAKALRAMQRQGMLHRDLKPENIMVTPAGRGVPTSGHWV